MTALRFQTSSASLLGWNRYRHPSSLSQIGLHHPNPALYHRPPASLFPSVSHYLSQTKYTACNPSLTWPACNEYQVTSLFHASVGTSTQSSSSTRYSLSCGLMLLSPAESYHIAGNNIKYSVRETYLTVTLSLAQPVKFLGCKLHTNACKQYIFQSCSKPNFNIVFFGWLTGRKTPSYLLTCAF